jgi:hypothetical protein
MNLAAHENRRYFSNVRAAFALNLPSCRPWDLMVPADLAKPLAIWSIAPTRRISRDDEISAPDLDGDRR